MSRARARARVLSEPGTSRAPVREEPAPLPYGRPARTAFAAR
ncbi:hypothetical protein [Streptomyces roseoviridis]